MTMIEDPAQIELRYSEAISDFAGAIQENGAMRVAKDFLEYYPTQCQDLVDCVYNTQKERRIAALFKP